MLQGRHSSGPRPESVRFVPPRARPGSPLGPASMTHSRRTWLVPALGLGLSLLLGSPPSANAQAPASGSGAGTGTGMSAGGAGSTGTGTESGSGLGSTSGRAYRPGL